MIKHEIRWEYILVICIILGTLPCNAQSVIPMPKEMVMGEGSWDVSADTRINYSNDALTKTVSLFNNYLDGRFGVTLKKGSKGKNAIHKKIIFNTCQAKLCAQIRTDNTGSSERR